jgi:hypothetical protein
MTGEKMSNLTEKQVREMIAGQQILNICLDRAFRWTYYYDPLVRRRIDADTGGGNIEEEEEEAGVWEDLKVLNKGFSDDFALYKHKFEGNLVKVVSQHYICGQVEYAKWSFPLMYLWLTENQIIQHIQEQIEVVNITRRERTLTRAEQRLQQEKDEALQREENEKKTLQELLAKYPLEEKVQNEKS